MKEETLRAKPIQELLELKRIPFCRVHCGSVRVRGGYMQLAPAGYPDWWTALGWLETKVPKSGRLSPEQIARHAELRGWGQRVAVVTSAEELERTLEGWLKARDFERAQGWI